jgi:PAS domain S-box-containing protein
LIRDENGRAIALVGTVRDETKRKQAEEALRIKDSAIASSINAIAIADLEGNLTYVNASFLSLWGYAKQEVLGRPATGFWEMEERASEVLQQLRWEGSWIGELVAKRKDGSPFYVQLSASMVKNEAGEPVCMMSSFIDIAERKQAEAALRESEEQFRNVLEVSRDLIYKLNLQTRTYDYVSPSSLRLVGFAPQEVVAMGLEGVRERFHPEDRERLGTPPNHLPDDTAEGREAPTIEYRWQCKDGEYRWLSDNRAFVLDEDGRALALVGTVRDITEAMAAAEVLRKSEERHRILFETIAQGIV